MGGHLMACYKAVSPAFCGAPRRKAWTRGGPQEGEQEAVFVRPHCTAVLPKDAPVLSSAECSAITVDMRTHKLVCAPLLCLQLCGHDPRGRLLHLTHGPRLLGLCPHCVGQGGRLPLHVCTWSQKLAWSMRAQRTSLTLHQDLATLSIHACCSGCPSHRTLRNRALHRCTATYCTAAPLYCVRLYCMVPQVEDMAVVDRIVVGSPYRNFTHPQFKTVMRMMEKEMPFVPRPEKLPELELAGSSGAEEGHEL